MSEVGGIQQACRARSMYESLTNFLTWKEQLPSAITDALRHLAALAAGFPA